MELKADLDWLAEEFDSLSRATENEYCISSQEARAYEADRKRAAEIIARIKLLVEDASDEQADTKP